MGVTSYMENKWTVVLYEWFYILINDEFVLFFLMEIKQRPLEWLGSEYVLTPLCKTKPDRFEQGTQ